MYHQYMESDHYSLLGVTRNSSTDEIQRSFRQKSLQHHPDKPSGDAELFKKLLAARDVLSDPTKRRAYDLTLPSQNKPSSGYYYTPFNSRPSYTRGEASPKKQSSTYSSQFYSAGGGSSAGGDHSHGQWRGRASTSFFGSGYFDFANLDSRFGPFFNDARSYKSQFAKSPRSSKTNNKANGQDAPRSFYDDSPDRSNERYASNHSKSNKKSKSKSKDKSYNSTDNLRESTQFTRTDDGRGSSYAYVKTERTKTADKTKPTKKSSDEPVADAYRHSYAYASNSNPYRNTGHFDPSEPGTRREPIIIEESDDDDFEITGEKDVSNDARYSTPTGNPGQTEESTQRQPPSPPVSPIQMENTYQNPYSQAKRTPENNSSFNTFPNKKPKFDMKEEFKNVPPFTQTDGNFDMGDISKNMPDSDDRPQSQRSPKKRRVDSGSGSNPRVHSKSPNTTFTPVNNTRPQTYGYSTQKGGAYFPDLQDGTAILHLPFPVPPVLPNLSDTNALAQYGISFEEYLLKFNEYRTHITQYFADRNAANSNIPVELWRSAEFVARYSEAIQHDKTAESLWRRVHETHEEVIATYSYIRERVDLPHN